MNIDKVEALINKLLHDGNITNINIVTIEKKTFDNKIELEYRLLLSSKHFNDKTTKYISSIVVTNKITAEIGILPNNLFCFVLY